MSAENAISFAEQDERAARVVDVAVSKGLERRYSADCFTWMKWELREAVKKAVLAERQRVEGIVSGAEPWIGKEWVEAIIVEIRDEEKS